MKVLFAVSSESISDAIIKRYQKEYKEILSYKNVYYFNAILKEIQKDKTYDRIIISEDLEPFSNNNYDTIDKFIFEKLDNISDEAQDSEGKETSIILICTDRHTKGSSFLVKIFGIGVYNALLGEDRRMENVCKLINKPRVKKEAKLYYKIDSEDVSYDPKSEKEVSELEIQNILTHFKKITKNKEKFADSFNNIASQYTDEQLKIIVNCLPINVKAVLEEECPKYQELMSASGLGIQKVGRTVQNVQDVPNKSGIKIDILENKNNPVKMSGPIVIPSSVKTSKNKSPVAARPMGNTITQPVKPTETKKIVKRVENKVEQKPQAEPKTIIKPQLEENDDILINLDDIEEKETITPKQEKAKIEKNITPSMFETNDFDDSLILDFEEDPDLDLITNDEEVEQDDSELLPDLDSEQVEDQVEEDLSEFLPDFVDDTEENVQEVKKGRGRPRKYPVQTIEKPKGKRGRPRKVQENPELEDDDSIMLDFEDEEDTLDLLEEDIDSELMQENDDELLELDNFEEEEKLSPDMFVDDSDDLEIIEETDEFELSDEEDTLELLEDDIDTELIQENDDDLLDFEEFENSEETEDFEMFDETEEFLSNESEEIDDNDEILLEFEELDENNDEILLESEEVEEDDDETLLDYEEVDDDEYTEEVSIPGIDELDDLEPDSSVSELEEYEEIDNDDYLLPGFEFDEKVAEEDSLLLDIEDNINEQNESMQSEELMEEEPILNTSNNYYSTNSNQIESIKPQIDYSMSSLNSLLTKDKKVVTFLGTTKNGTSFLVNNLASFFSSVGINTAILDMTKNKNSYYIYTKNEEELRKIAYTSIEKLQNGFPEGIKVDKNLTVYTALPNDGKDYSNAEPILSTLVQNHSLILIDCDFDTDPSYFASCQEIYLVQSMDILTIQPLTAFLRDLKTQGVLESEKVRVVINKEIKVRSLSTKAIIGGMSFYNDPAMSFMTELFNRDMVKACTIPFEEGAYSKYLDAMVNCNVSIHGYSKDFMNKLKVLGNMVYPLTSKQTYQNSKPSQGYAKNAFSSNINNTLNQMKNKY